MARMNAEPTLRYVDADYEHYVAGRFVFAADGEMVIVSKDDHDSGGIITVASYTYKTHEAATDAAWAMARKQMRA